MAWNKIKNCANPLLTTEPLAYYCKKSEWDAQIALSTIVGNKITAFPEAVAPFLKNLAIGKDTNFAATITGGNVAGQGYFGHSVAAMLFPVTATDFADLQSLQNCDQIVMILERTPLAGEGSFVVFGHSVGLEVVADGYTQNMSVEGGAASLTFTTNTENGRYEKYNTVVIHVTDYATTKAAIEANVVAPA